MSADNINADTQIPQSEEKKWRLDEMNNGEHITTVVISPNSKTEGVSRRLSGMKEIAMSCSPAKLTEVKRPGAFFVRLADESPRRNCTESDTSTYDSRNCCETDLCRDSSDTDTDSSFSCKNIETTINVLEYEVASASGSENLFSSDSSSGTDGVYIAEVAIYKTPKYSSDFADTEEDSPDPHPQDDPELGPADYWVCVKCKNKKNNPMFCYCEKCYQVRKSHFPPRPRLRKNRSTIKSHNSQTASRFIQRSSSVSEVDDTTGIKGSIHKLKDPVNSIIPTTSNNSVQSGSLSTPGRLLVGISQSQINSTGESSSDDSNTASQTYKHLNNIPNGLSTLGKNNEQEPAQHPRRETKRKFPKVLSKYNTSAKRTRYEEKPLNHALLIDSKNETDFSLSPSLCGTQDTLKDSGFSSAPSSQERKNENDDDCGLGGDNDGETSDTVSDALDETDIALNSDLFSTTVQLLDRPVSFSVQRSTTEPNAISPLVQSISKCSDAYTNIKPSHSNPELLKISPLQSERSTANDGGFPTYGSCMTCLTEPKNGVFVHSRFLHLCCCYKCAVKIWNKNKKCPICNCAVKNVMKLFVH